MAENTQKITIEEINVGDRVRSFDFADGNGRAYGRDIHGERANYVEGVVVAKKELEGCERLVIMVDRHVSAGEEIQALVGKQVFPPVNGTPKTIGGICVGVTQIA